MFQKIKKRNRRSKTDDFYIIDHAKERQDARNISDAEIALVLDKGKRKHQGGKILVTYKGLKVVLSGDGTTIITAYKPSYQ